MGPTLMWFDITGALIIGLSVAILLHTFRRN